jgi:hypothetical protein
MAAVIGDEMVEGIAPEPTRRANAGWRRLPIWRWVILLVVGAYFIIPLVAALRFTGFSAFPAVFDQEGFSAAFELSVRLALITTVATLVLMPPTTIYVHLRMPRLRRLMEGVTILPIVIPPVVLIVGVLQVAPGFLKGTPYLLALEYVVLAMPFAYRAFDAGLRALDLQTLVEASHSLGEGWGTTPRVLLLDEPLSALDAKVRLQLREQIRSLQQRLGTTTLFVTHDQEEALSMADRVGVMRDGTLEQIASPSELYAHPATAFVAEFVGIMNRIPSELLSLLGGVPAAADGPADPSGAVDALVRPKGLRIAASPNGNGIVTNRTFLGQLTRISVRLTGDVVVQVDQQSTDTGTITPGSSVEVSLLDAPVLVAERR